MFFLKNFHVIFVVTQLLASEIQRIYGLFDKGFLGKFLLPK